jgi:exodeoxyribonuclease VII small subunit
MPKKSEIAIEKLGYEKAFAELEQIVTSLENESLSLEESMQIFDRGQKLVEHCNQLLDHAELKIQKLSKLGEMEKDE